MHNFTQEDLLQYLYNDTSIEKAAAIRAALLTYWDLREEFNLLSSSQQQLDTIKFSPRTQAIDKILRYAEKSVEELSSPA